MIKSIRLKNFFSFKEETIHLNTDRNVVVGINGSGKSNFFKAIRLLCEGVAGMGLKKLILENWGGINEIFFKGSNDDCVELEFVFQSKSIKRYGHDFEDDIHYFVGLSRKPGQGNYFVTERVFTKVGLTYCFLEFDNGQGELKAQQGTFTNDKAVVRYKDYDPQELTLGKVFDTDRYYPLTTLRSAIADIAVYDYFDTSPNSRIRKAMKATSEKRLLPDGSNMPQILNTIKINHKPQYYKIVEMLNKVNGRFRGFDFHFIGSGNIELMLDEDGLDSSIHISHISDGTLRYLCLLSILMNPNRGGFICIDEPEMGLHPDMIHHVAQAVRGVASAYVGPTMLLATYSENILQEFDIRDVRVFEKAEGNCTKVKSYKEKDFEGWYQRFHLGHLWRNGSIGGKRWESCELPASEAEPQPRSLEEHEASLY